MLCKKCGYEHHSIRGSCFMCGAVLDKSSRSPGGYVSVPQKPDKLSIGTLCRLMDDCLPEQIENEQDMQKLIDKLWPALVCEFERRIYPTD